MADRDIEVVIRAADEFSATLNKAKTEFNSTASEIARGSEKFETSWDKSLRFLRSRIALVIASIYMMKKAWDFAFETATSTENKEVLKFMNDIKDTIELIKLKLGEFAIVIGAAFINVFAGIGSAINFVFGKITGAVAMIAGGAGLGGISAAFKEISENSLEASKLGEQYAESAKRVGAAVRQGLLTINETTKEATAAENEHFEAVLTTQEIINKAIKNYETAEDKIRNLVFETAKLGATEEQLIAIEQAKFIATGATIDQIERYTTALQQSMEAQEQAAAAKERAAMSSAAYKEYASTQNRQTEFQQQENPYETFTAGIVAQSSPVAAEYLQYQQRIQALQQFQQEEMNLLLAHNTAKVQLAIAQGASETEIAGLTNQSLMEVKDMEAQHHILTEKMKWQAAVAGTAAALMATGQMMMTGSKKEFERGKKLALAGAIVSTAQAVMNAAATQPFFPMGLIMAALAASMGAIQISKIQSTHYMGGTSGAASIGMPSIPSLSEGAVSTPTSLTEQAQAKPSQDISINVYALDPSSVNWDKLAENNIIPAINNAGDRNIKMNVNVLQTA